MQFDTMSHTLYTLFYSLLPIRVHYIEQLVYLRSLCLGPNLGLLLNILVLPFLLVSWRFFSFGSITFTCSSSLQIKWMLGWAKSQKLLWAWVVCGLINLPAFCYGHHQSELSSIVLISSSVGVGHRAVSPVPLPSESALLCCPV